MFKEYTHYDGLGLARLVKEKDVTPSEILEAAIERAERLNPRLNVIIHSFYERARKLALSPLPKGPFQGVPFLLKDLHDNYEKEPITLGSRGIRHIPSTNSELVNRYLATGLIPFGKTNTPELGMTITTEPKAHGPSHNPFRHGVSTGGSSGGSAGAVAAGIVPLASGSDGGGSIRFPAACCGVFGMKPSRGLTPMGPGLGEGWDGAVAHHVITRSVRDSAAMLNCTAGPETGGPYRVSRDDRSYLDAVNKPPAPLHIAFSRRPFIEKKLHPEAVKGLEQTAKLLESLGHHVEESEPSIDRSMFWKHYLTVVSSHIAVEAESIKKVFGKDAFRLLEPTTLSIAMVGRSLTSCDLVRSKKAWHDIQLSMGRFLTSYDMFLTPTLVNPPFAHGTVNASAFNEKTMIIASHFPIGRALMKTGLIRIFSEKTLNQMGFTALGNITGLPGMSVPLHWTTDSLPMGMLFTGRMCDEYTLYQLAGQLEQAQPWADRRPEVI